MQASYVPESGIPKYPNGLWKVGGNGKMGEKRWENGGRGQMWENGGK